MHIKNKSVHLHHQNGSDSHFGIGDSVAQLVEHNTFNVGVLGSSPSGITKQLKKRLTYNKLGVFLFRRYNIGKTLTKRHLKA